MSIEIHCRGCQALLRVADEHAGKQARCPKCGTIQTVPGGAPQVMAPVEPSPESTRAAAGSRDPVSREPNAAHAGNLDASNRAGGFNPTQEAPEQRSLPDPRPLASNNPSPTTPSGNEQWYVLTPDGIEYGPVGRAELDAWVGESRISTQCRLRRSDGQWMAASFFYANLPVASNSVIAANSNRIVPTVVYPEPHRGTTILTLGILGLLCTCPFLSIAAWVAGAKDLGKMQAQVMDPAGREGTKVGYVLGMFASIFWIGIACIIMAMFIANNLD